MQVREYAADDEVSVRAGADILNAVQAHETPWIPPVTLHRRQMQVRHGWDGTRNVHLMAWLDGVAVGVAEVELPTWDNVDLAWTYLNIHPEHRRRGHGSQFLAEIEQLCREAGRTKIGGSGWDVPGTRPFAEKHGYRLASQDIHRIVYPRQLPEGFFEQAYAEAEQHTGDYELVRIEGRVPESLIAEVSELTGAINDAPIDDLDIEDEVFPEERIRAYENATIESGHRLYRVLARHRGTGELAGHTVVAVDSETPTQGHQHDTTVVKAHRGHRLGVLLKSDLMRWLAAEEPQIEMIDTWNAESNEHMIAVNERLGYRIGGRELAFQRRL